MVADPEFLDHACDLFADLGPIRIGRLFGGSALYRDEAMFATIWNHTIYMKADKPLAAEYAAAKSTPFSYSTKSGQRVIPGLMSLPESALENADEAMTWAQKSMIPARKAAAQKRRKRGK